MQAMDLLSRAGELGIRVVQVADNMPMHLLPGQALHEFAVCARESGITVELGTRGIDPARLRPYLRLATVLRSTIVRTIVDAADHEPGGDEIVRTIRGLVPDLEQAGVCLGIENHDRIPAQDLARIVERIDSSNVGICLDTVNSFGALEGPEVVVEALAPWTVNLHLKEFTIRRFPHMMGFTVEGRPLGQGRLDVAWLLAQLEGQDRDPNAILEQWTPPADTLEATIAQEAAWVAESVAFARRFIPD